MPLTDIITNIVPCFSATRFFLFLQEDFDISVFIFHHFEDFLPLCVVVIIVVVVVVVVVVTVLTITNGDQLWGPNIPSALIYNGRLQSSWTRLITPSRSFVEVR
jgi:hypothetical protein